MHVEVLEVGESKRYCPKCERVTLKDVTKCPECGGGLQLLASDDLTGELIDGRYRILKCIGKGGMGVVYKARQEYLDRIVAVKFLRRDVVSQDLKKRFLLEAKAVARLKNPHTVMLHEFGVTQEGVPYFSMEYCQGVSLRRALRKEGRIEWRRAARIALQVCESLAEAHAEGIIHRDLKPENIFLASDKHGNEMVKVLDFGIARLLETKDADRLTRYGTMVGTPEYVSPEQAESKPVDPRSDLYSLGVVLYEMLSGRPPFSADNITRVLFMQVNEPPPDIPDNENGYKVPEAIRMIVRRCLAKDPSARPQSAFDLAAELRNALGEAHIGATRRIFHYGKDQLVRLTGKGRRSSTAAYSRLRSGSAGADSFPPSQLSTDERAELSAASTIGRLMPTSRWWWGAAGAVGLVAVAALFYSLTSGGTLGGESTSEIEEGVGAGSRFEGGETPDTIPHGRQSDGAASDSGAGSGPAKSELRAENFGLPQAAPPEAIGPPEGATSSLHRVSSPSTELRGSVVESPPSALDATDSSAVKEPTLWTTGSREGLGESEKMGASEKSKEEMAEGAATEAVAGGAVAAGRGTGGTKAESRKKNDKVTQGKRQSKATKSDLISGPKSPKTLSGKQTYEALPLDAQKAPVYEALPGNANR